MEGHSLQGFAAQGGNYFAFENFPNKQWMNKYLRKLLSMETLIFFFSIITSEQNL